MRLTDKPTLSTLVPRDVMGALAALGIDADERGDEAVALCPHPAHDDSHASWSCNLDTGLFNCFSCGFSGSFIRLAGLMLGKTGGAAEQWVRARKIRDVADGLTGPRERVSRPLPVVSEADMWKFTEPPQDALDDRGLTAEACQQYDVRWDDSRGLWITPVRDPRTGQLWGWQEKSAGYFRNRPLDVPKSKSVFGFQSLRPGGTAVLVESPLDVPYLSAAGTGGAVSGYGVSVSREQLGIIRGRAGEVVLALDNDRAGWKGTGTLAYAFGTTPVRVFNYGSFTPGPFRTQVVEEDSWDGADPGDLTAEEIAWGIKHAVSVWNVRIPWL